MGRELPIIVLCSFLGLQSCKKSPSKVHPIAGSHVSNDPVPEKAQLQERGDCAHEVDGRVIVIPKTLAELDFSRGLASIHTKQYGWLFVMRDGTTIRTVAFDNGPDYFAEGLARYVDEGKTGFIDASGKIIIKAQFGFASPFEGRFSRVCNDFVTEKMGEHSFIKSSNWGCIDKNGQIVLPMKYSKEELSTAMRQLPHG